MDPNGSFFEVNCSGQATAWTLRLYDDMQCTTRPGVSIRSDPPPLSPPPVLGSKEGGDVGGVGDFEEVGAAPPSSPPPDSWGI